MPGGQYILICTGPSAPHHLSRPNQWRGCWRFATVNAGFRLMGKNGWRAIPDIYLCIEKPTIEHFLPEIVAMQERGTAVWSTKARARDLGSWCESLPDERDLPARERQKLRSSRQGYRRHHYAYLRSSGVACLQLLCDHYQADEVHIFGMDGYDIDQLYAPELEHNVLTPTTREKCQLLNQRSAAYIAMLSQAVPTRLVFHGRPSNWRRDWRCEVIE